jgi:enoyl-CoA hydratase
MTAPLLVHRDGDIQRVRLNRPHRRNALDPDLVGALDAAVANAMADPTVRVVVISGEGLSFCAGADLYYLHAAARDGQDPMPFLRAVSACFDRIEQAPKPVVAFLHGHAVAGGLELALACDVVVAHTATLIGDGHVLNGLLPAGGSTVRLARKVGEPLARWLLLTGQLLPAEAFVASGFVHAIADPDCADSVLDGVLEALCEPPVASQKHLKMVLHDQYQSAHEAAIRAEHAAFVRNWDDGQLPHALDRFVSR